MSFLKHVGKHGDRKVAVLFREVPGEPHMCLVTYTETLNRHIHDPMMQCIESQIGQQTENLADALNRVHTVDGKYILQVLHAQGMIKKVRTADVMMTPNSTTSIKLDELNKILTEMKQGEDAVRKLAEMDASRGIHPGNPADVARSMRNYHENQQAAEKLQAANGALGDNAIANNLRQQAARMAAEAKGLLAESDRLLKEAAGMDGVQPEASVNTTEQSAPVKRGRGRPAKAKAPVL